jgi:hypothetical protein
MNEIIKGRHKLQNDHLNWKMAQQNDKTQHKNNKTIQVFHVTTKNTNEMLGAGVGVGGGG